MARVGDTKKKKSPRRVPYLMAGYLGEHVLGMPKSYERLGSKKARVPDISFGIRWVCCATRRSDI